ncbi:COP23 domain-containing protein [Acaryochloris sp. IP29b_bin.137]|uniref:COP23 domain-containing protein n=1 Tax=Acaryochloris sp. IP29b_bin.137 TaxID=2969217 RepID=UPI00260209AC|nr:COP23 domain-containing protein [Acaryochloris sp. IP29b_bin.137]
MKRHPITSLIAFSVVAGATLIMGNQPAQAGEQRFSCSLGNGTPTTMAKTKRGYVPVIRWTSKFFGASGWSPEARCAEVSDRFESYYKKGNLNFLTTGRINRQSVVCVADYKGGPCSGLLFTLKPGSNPGRTLQQLLSVRVGASGPLNESTARVYIDMEDFLSKAPVEKEVEANSPSPQPKTDVTPPQTKTPATSATPLGLW